MIEDFRCNTKTSGGGANINLVTWILLRHLNVVAVVVAVLNTAIRRPIPQ